ncbi:peptide chain release factor 1 [Bulleidia sp. HCP3S3_F2]|uniref:peptide chain release factor 1 n=1 Tax=unclassified Bulleidia TaxID=2704656 RepID=UPI003F8C7610
MDAVREKLIELEKQYNEISDQLISDEVISNPRKITKLSKEQAQLSGSVEAWHELQEFDSRIMQAEEMLAEEDPEMKEMAQIELDECVPEREALLEKIQKMLIPRDPEDGNDVIMEIRGGAGGDEGNIFAGDLYRMYTRYAESQSWKVQVMEASVSEAGGFSQIVFSIKGTDVYKALKWESGVHRVQRVPKTETQGRIHTSTATVLCQPEIEEEDFELDMNDLTFETHRASGAGGQHINKTDSAVRIVHIPTGITVNCQEGRSQIENRETAIRIIRARVYEEMQKEKEEAAGKERRAKIGTGDRSEKIRTYNYPQNRVTDHRIHFSVNHLDQIMEGKLQEVIDALQAEEERRKLEVSE